jgi:hypothetical protein
LLFVSENTVRAHVRSLMQKLNADNRTQLAIYAMRHGFGLDTRTPAPQPAPVLASRNNALTEIQRLFQRRGGLVAAASAVPTSAA